MTTMKPRMIAALWMAGMFAVVAGTATPVFAGATAPAAPAQRSTPGDSRQILLDNIASLNEDLVQFALDGNAVKIGQTANAIEASLPKLRTAVPAATFTAIESRVREQRAAVKSGNRTATALASVELYRLLQEAIEPRSRVVPVQVSLLDYAGFKILALAKGGAVPWAGIDATVKEAASFWKAVEPRIGSVALRNMMGSIMTGLVDASAAKDAAYAAFAAKMLLDSVDLLEGQFTAK
jgi:hypothetical protein